MKRNRMMNNPTTNRPPQTFHAVPADTRQGSTIVIVLVLVSMLMVLGFVFFTLASQELVSSQNFSDAAKGSDSSKFDYFEFTLRQIIIGANQNEPNSALFGGRHSLMSTMFGRDIQPFSGDGVNLSWNSDLNYPMVDSDYDPTTLERWPPNDPAATLAWTKLLDHNDSPGAVAARPRLWDPLGLNPGDPTQPDLSLLGRGGLSSFPAPDGDYTYPDQNNLFLAHDGMIPLIGSNPERMGHLSIPSYLRPQVLRHLTEDEDANGTLDQDEDADGDGIIDTLGSLDPLDPNLPWAWEWFSHPATARRVLRPHKEHRAVTNQKTVSTFRRFVSDRYPEAGMQSFPFDEDTNGNGVLDAGEDLNGDGILDTFRFGFWSQDIDPTGKVVYELDADPDGDGVKDAIYIDLQFPLMERDGQLFVGMAAVKIIDADGKLNLNAHGNLAGTTNIDNAPFFGGDNFISRSNQALSSWEVNPQWALYANDPASVFDQHISYYDHAPDNFRELANMELNWIQTGRPKFDPTGPINSVDNMVELFPGRYGEFELLPNAWISRDRFEFPGPGFTFQQRPVIINFDPSQNAGTDDNNNLYEGSRFRDWANQVFPSFVNGVPLEFLPYRHPLDLRGAGRFVQPDGKRRLFAVTTASFDVGRHKWPQYLDYAAHPDAGYRQLDLSTTSPFLPGFIQSYQVDEPAEMILEPKLRSDLDATFGADENAPLQLSNNDMIALDITGRVNTLAPVNLSRENEHIRKQFTVTSWDLKTYGKSFFLNMFGADGSPGERNFDDDGNGVTDFYPNGFPDFAEWGAPGSDDVLSMRAWEFNADTEEDVNYNGRLDTTPFNEDTNGDGKLNGDGRIEFPPSFRDPRNWPFGQLFNEPFRRELRDLLMIEVGDINVRKIQRRLSINGVLDRNPRNGRLRFRPLTPHPTGLAPDAVNQQLEFPFPPVVNPESITTAVEQESLARRDRQLMARDIYVLLYTLGGGNDAQNYTLDNSTFLLYSEDQLKTMAQLAVNIVDAFDPDDVITVFEYDKNLANGWNLNDNPYHDSEDLDGDGIPDTEDDNGNGILDPGEDLNNNGIIDFEDLNGNGAIDLEDPAEQGIVFGVEEQKLTFSEILTFKTTPITGNNPATEYDDSFEHYFSHLELRNVSPSLVRFDNAAWRIRVEPVPSGGLPLPDRRLILGPLAAPGGIAGGELFNIRTANDASVPETDVMGLPGAPYSFFKVDPQFTTAGTQDFLALRSFIAPPVQVLVASQNLDLIRRGFLGSTFNFFWVTNSDGLDLTATAGSFLGEFNATSIPDPLTTEIQFVLERRVNLTRIQPINFVDGSPQNIDNPWVEVDRMVLPQLREFNIISDSTNATSMPNLSTRLQLVNSRLRRQPLDRQSERWAGPYQVNFIHKKNSLTDENDNHPLGVLNPFPLWQPHFDRDYASVIELFHVPLYGPDGLTLYLRDRVTADPLRFEELSTAGSRFLNPTLPIAIPDGTDTLITFTTPSPAPDPNPPNPATPSYDNRWHRLLEFVEVPTRASKHFDTPWFTVDVGKFPTRNDPNPLLRIFRQPGKINLNTIQYPTVLAGLVDDRDVFGDFEYDFNNDTFLNPNEEVDIAPNSLGVRDFMRIPGSLAADDLWKQFLRSRDGTDPLPFALGGMGTGFTLPGVPSLREHDLNQNGVYTDPGEDLNGNGIPDPLVGSRPFRSLGFGQRGISLSPNSSGHISVEDTILRERPIDITSTIYNRRLFEVGTQLEHQNNDIDHTVKHRLLAKVFNNSTTRSNVFLVFIQIDFFEAKQVDWLNPATGRTEQVVRVGRKLDEVTFPKRRGFFVIDRSSAMESIHQQTEFIPRQWRDRKGIDRFSYSFYNNGVNRSVSPPQDVSIPMDYRPLILHREIIEGGN